MELKIETVKYVRTVINDTIITIPETPFAWQSFNCRKLILVMPEFTNWLINGGAEKEELYQLNIILLDVSNMLISRESLRITKENIETALLLNNGKPGNVLLYEVVNYIKTFFGSDAVSIDTFNIYYLDTIKRISEGLNINFVV